MNADGTGFNTCKECHKTESLWNLTTADHKEEEQLEDRRKVGQSSCNFGDGTDEKSQSLMFMMMMMNIRGQTLVIKRIFLSAVLVKIYADAERNISETSDTNSNSRHWPRTSDCFMYCQWHFTELHVSCVILSPWYNNFRKKQRCKKSIFLMSVNYP